MNAVNQLFIHQSKNILRAHTPSIKWILWTEKIIFQPVKTVIYPFMHLIAYSVFLLFASIQEQKQECLDRDDGLRADQSIMNS